MGVFTRIARFFKLHENATAVKTEFMAGLTTFLTMTYIIFLQPAILSGALFGMDTGMDFGAVMTATCLSAALASLIMGIYANYPIAQAPGMGENFFFIFSAIPAAATLTAVQQGQTTAWQVALGVVFISGVLFLLLSLCGIRSAIVDAASPSMKNGIAVGIGLFIAFIGLQNTGLILPDQGTGVKLNTAFLSPDLLLFFTGLFITTALHVRRVRGAIFLGIIISTLLALGARLLIPALPETIAGNPLVKDSLLMNRFSLAQGLVSHPPSLAPTFARMDIVHALSARMIPFIVIFLFMDTFDTIGTLIGVCEQAGFIRDNKLPRANRAMLSDAIGTVAGAVLGTSTVTSFIESTTGVEHGGRTGLTAVFTAFFFVLALFFSPLVHMVASYAPITAPAMLLVGTMMIRNVVKIDWHDFSEAVPAFLVMIGIPFTYSIGDGLALGFISYPLIKFLSGKGRDVKPTTYLLCVILQVYFMAIR